MTVLHNEMIIEAPVEKIWEALSQVNELDKFDPTVLKSRTISEVGSGIGAARKVEMKDGKNWFEEKCTLSKPNEALVYELTACSFPVDQLKHSYSFEKIGQRVRVRQTMQYKVKYGWIGEILDALVIRRQTDSGIKQFFSGLKTYMEN
jgi:ribosome-associated toxin RatA of RatAB toxin-antitoxin module